MAGLRQLASGAIPKAQKARSRWAAQRESTGRVRLSERTVDRPAPRPQTTNKLEEKVIMSTLPLQIVLHGLVALVPVDNGGQVNHMTALLLDGRNPPAHDCVTAHQPSLRFRVAPIAACQAVTGCSVNGNICTCNDTALAGNQISLEIQPAPSLPLVSLDKAPPHPLPASKQEAVSFGYVVNMAQPPFSLQVDQKYLAQIPPGNLLARMDVPFTTVIACNLFGRVDDGRHNAHTMSMRTIGSLSTSG
ncbi:MAG TPA: hypothetical protein VEY89_09680, partial [Candidatus Dormibacteraeota bacterium]|nr:hypothetical protein [Candidatus Dormibacteraeota bacterium]